MSRSFLRDNAFLAAAMALPLVVVGLFLLFTAIPRWTVPPPQHDLLFSTNEYSPVNPGVAVDFAVQDGTLRATVRPVPANSHAPRTTLWRYDHEAETVREIDIDLPALAPGDLPQTITIDTLAGRVLAQQDAPDGYELRSRDSGDTGIVGEIFGMRRYDRALSIAKGGRVVTIPVPSSDAYRTPQFVGWIVGAGGP